MIKPRGIVFIGVAVALLATSVMLIDRRFRHDRVVSPVIASPIGKVETRTCAECHPGIAERFLEAPHSRTLRRGDDPQVLEAFANRSIELAGQRIRFDARGDELWVSNSQLPFDLRVDWVFGSGHHAMTPGAIDHDPDGNPRLTQFPASLMADGQLGPTPGSGLSVTPEESGSPDGGQAPMHGITSDADDTRRCFGCHSGYLPETDGRIELGKMRPNLDCSRCHPSASRHAASGGEIRPALDWADLSPLESINRCGECHRRADELTADEVTPDQTHLIRFAPVGMAMSPCFRSSQMGQASEGSGAKRFSRFDCVTCHDPHSPAVTDPEYYNDTCRNCHTPHDEVASPADRRALTTAPCPVQPVDSSCIDCHMPKVELIPGLSFTDHWIRVRESR